MCHKKRQISSFDSCVCCHNYLFVFYLRFLIFPRRFRHRDWAQIDQELNWWRCWRHRYSFILCYLRLFIYRNLSAMLGKERSCDTLLMCILTTLNNGLRNGGGIGDVLRKPSSSVMILKFSKKFVKAWSFLSK